MRTLFLVQLIAAAFLLLMAGFVSARPYALLDVVLTSEQLSDQAIKDDTLALMQRTTGSDAACWLVAGLVIGTTSAIGLFSAKTGDDA